ncbi:hypothetical protein NC652_016888 [Populus alba x Populus x berolinensis]|uniref:Uncharacterized protein n=1 Tax=Populus alba x Populus x berolinensis TaxID=444605 RepID=A0AAD6VZT3_9ROSI|nr:hypothetical protein NC652_016888 [Populus alba x Populus x berolinensis]KAJ6993843.1 hypothetical protein NC653_016843 [Populus alba x Populus x berolinensis]
MEPCEGEKGSTSISNAQPTLEGRKRKHIRICQQKQHISSLFSATLPQHKNL